METMTLERIQYREVQAAWRTPRGRPCTFVIREGTNDWNTQNAILAADEYGLRDLHLDGLAVDIGAYLGGVAIALALDNPDLRVVAVEAIGENADLVSRNAELNGVADRVTVLHRAAAEPGFASVDVFWRAQGNAAVEHHAFVGNSTLIYEHGDIGHETETVACVSLAGIRSRADDAPIAFLKIDCEGCEWSVLQDPEASDIPLIHGEWHNVHGHTRADLVALLPDHDVTFSGPVDGPGGFVAVRRG